MAKVLVFNACFYCIESLIQRKCSGFTSHVPSNAEEAHKRNIKTKEAIFSKLMFKFKKLSVSDERLYKWIYNQYIWIGAT